MANFIKYILPITIVVLSVIISIYNKNYKISLKSIGLLIIIGLIVFIVTMYTIDHTASIVSAPLYVYGLLEAWLYIVGVIILVIFHVIMKYLD